jgi:hypothetical protein
LSQPRNARSGSERAGGRLQSETSDDIDRQRIRQWLDYVRSNPPSPSYYWRPVIAAFLMVCAIFISLLAIDLGG